MDPRLCFFDRFFLHPNTLVLHLHKFLKCQNCPCKNDQNDLLFFLKKNTEPDGGAILFTFSFEKCELDDTPSSSYEVHLFQCRFTVDDNPIIKLTILIINTTHELLINIFFFTFHLFKALIQIEANTQILLPDLRCKCCRLSSTRTDHFCWWWRWKTYTMTEPDATVKQWIGCKQRENESDKSG